MRFVISFLFGLLAEIATGLVIAAGLFITRSAPGPTNDAEFPAWVPIVAIVAGSVFTFAIGLWRASRQRDRVLMHGVLVAAGAVTLHLGSTLGAGQSLTTLHIVADVLKLVAGAAAGEIARRRSRLSTSSAPSSSRHDR
jgi:hypothetical protein